jgi:4a-hydroxytetrahydrobiopterin dehydratase
MEPIVEITPKQFHESTGVEDWRVLADGASAMFRTGSFAAGAAVVDAIAKLAAAVDHHADVDLRPDAVTVRLWTRNAQGFFGLSNRDVELARAISAAARDLNAAAAPDAVQTVQLTLDAFVDADVMPFWAAVLGYEKIGEEDVVDPQRRGPSIWFQTMRPARTERNRFHIDVWVPEDQAEARVAAALAAGGRIVYDKGAPTWWTLADAEGNEVDVATTFGRS